MKIFDLGYFFFQLLDITPIAMSRALQWSENPYGNEYGVEMDENGVQIVIMLRICLDLGEAINLTRAPLSLQNFHHLLEGRGCSNTLRLSRLL